MTDIHATAIVSEGAEIDSGCSVGPYTCIGPNVTLGKNSRVGSHVVIDGYTELGENNTVYQFASVGAAPQDTKWQGEPTRLVIGNNNVIREYVTVQPGLEQFGGITRVGNENLLMACCHIAHDVVMGNQNWVANSAALAGHVEVGSHVIFAGLSGAHQFCRIGDNAFISAGSMVAQDVPPYCLVQGDRARLKSINKIGLERAGFTQERIVEIQRIFKMLFVSKESLEKKISDVEVKYSDSFYAKKLIEFIKSSERGIVSWRRSNKR
ncbi:acyl-ACP--UDP-N-acetylglucosamine O-acyltransferase [Pelagibius sp. Alg239-R121]|uniref:acyl-ACP--UDP-N-acetylglucosamine O-acyltransferase n=1 Tax=Pelagibius sp. Alg239-R121 TaxID=2993448 RepID=UPI0024A6BB08|nr:acyl-ACP--UDP-N-acetylglucosamine O-acyltransferase [Pelagibius sp. Alg239-R121]